MSIPQQADSHSAEPADSLTNPQEQGGHPVPPSQWVYQLILEQFWGDGVSKREIRSVYTTASDANASCQDYLLRTWPRDQFSLYEIGSSPQRPELSKVSALINGDRFHVWIEQHSWEGTLDFSSKAIAKRVGKGPNAYILQRTIKDASGGKRRSTTRGVFATRQLAKHALTQDQPPSEWSSNDGYVLEPGGEYAHAIAPSGKTAWLFIEVRPLYMSYTHPDQEQELHEAGDAPPQHLGATALNPISLDQIEDVASYSPAPSAFSHSTHLSTHHPQSSLDNPFSPLPSNPDEAGAFVYLVLQLKTIPYTPPILTVEAVTYEIDVANRFGIALLGGFIGSGVVFEPAFREDGCLQGNFEQHTRDEGLMVWVEKRAVVLGDESMDFDLMSEHDSVQLNRAYQDSERSSKLGFAVASFDEVDEVAAPMSGFGGQKKREKPENGFEVEGRPVFARSQSSTKLARVLHSGANENGENSMHFEVPVNARYRIVSVSRHHHPGQARSDPLEGTMSHSFTDSFEDLSVAVVRARMMFYSSLARLDIATLDIRDSLDAESEGSGREKNMDRVIQARSRADPSLVLLGVRVEDGQVY